jgi:peptidoglycan hydrolase CwlO-like protein
MIKSSKIRTKQEELNALKKKVKPIETELWTLCSAWDSTEIKPGTERITYLENELNRLLNQIKDKKQELKILKGDAERENVPAWKEHREEIGLECF